jgi:hypothetical protein
VGEKHNIELEGIVAGYGSIARAHIDDSTKSVEKAERIPNIHDAMLAKSYLQFLEQSWSKVDPEDPDLKGLFKCPKCGSVDTEWQRK